jgi:hypothetical protein
MRGRARMGLPSNRRRVHMPLPPKCHTVTRARFTLLVACQRPLIELLHLQGKRTKKLFQVEFHRLPERCKHLLGVILVVV